MTWLMGCVALAIGIAIGAAIAEIFGPGKK